MRVLIHEKLNSKTVVPDYLKYAINWNLLCCLFLFKTWVGKCTSVSHLCHTVVHNETELILLIIKTISFVLVRVFAANRYLGLLDFASFWYLTEYFQSCSTQRERNTENALTGAILLSKVHQLKARAFWNLVTTSQAPRSGFKLQFYFLTHFIVGCLQLGRNGREKERKDI